MSVLKIKNTPAGAWQPIASIKGEKGDAGPAGGNVTDAVKYALLRIANHVYYDDNQRDAYIQNLEDALFPPTDIVSLAAVYTQSGAVYDNSDIDDLKTDLVVTATMTGGTTKTVAAADYFLDGKMDVGTQTITVSYRGQTATFDVVVSRAPTGLVDGTYTAVDGNGNPVGGDATVSSNTVAGSSIVAYNYLDIPFINPIKLKAGDVVTLKNIAAAPSTTASTAFNVSFNKGSSPTTSTTGFYPWRGTPIDGKVTVNGDFLATSIRFDTYGTMNSRVFTLKLLVNSEVVF